MIQRKKFTSKALIHIGEKFVLRKDGDKDAQAPEDDDEENSAKEDLDYAKKLIEAFKSRENFLDFFASTDLAEDGKIEIDNWAIELANNSNKKERPYHSRNHFKNGEFDCTKKIAGLFRNLKRREAADPGIWSYVNYCLVEREIVDPDWFCGELTKTDAAVDTHDDIEGSAGIGIVKEARTIWRRFTGIHLYRGRRDLYYICPPARDWWINKIAEDICSTLPSINKEELIRILLVKPCWEILIERSVSHLTVVSESNIKAAILYYLYKKEKDSKENEIRNESLKKENLTELLKNIGQLCSTVALGYLDAVKIEEIINDELHPI